MLRTYETLLLLSPELGVEGRGEVLETLKGVIQNQGGQPLEIDEWGMRDLAYPVKKQNRGYYVLITFGLEGPKVAELERIIRITDGIFKFVIVQLSDTFAAAEQEA